MNFRLKTFMTFAILGALFLFVALTTPPYIYGDTAFLSGKNIERELRTMRLCIKGAKTERVVQISKFTSRTLALPGTILDAHLVEEQTGDGQLGPSDFTSFCALTVAPEDVAAWRKATLPLEPHNTPPKLLSPKQAQAWWVTQSDFNSLELHSPKSLNGRNSGWIGLAPDGRIFV